MATDNTEGLTVCTNLERCSLAIVGEKIPWYRGAGEYCPECGEILIAPGSMLAVPPIAVSKTGPAPSDPPEEKTVESRALPPETEALPADNPTPSSTSSMTPPPDSASSPPGRTASAPLVLDDSPRAQRERSRSLSPSRRRWRWIVGGVLLVAVVAAWVAGRRPRIGSDVTVVCPSASAHDFAAALVRAYAAETGTPQNRLAVSEGDSCDVRFTSATAASDAVIAHDAIVVIVNARNPIRRLTEDEVRGIFSGSIRDWSQLGRDRGAIVPILPATSSDEANIMSLSILSGVGVDRGVRRGGTSADVMHAVTDGAGRDAIGLVAFSQGGGARIVPLALFPEPSTQSIAAGRYPYSWAIAIESDSARGAGAAMGLLNYARSHAGAAITQRYGLAGNI
jgi:hypothetical protein